MPFTDELILQQLSEINAALRRLEGLLQRSPDAPQMTAPSPHRFESLRDYPHVFCDEKTAAELTGMSKHFFSRLRCYGGGPPYTKLGTGKGAAVRYKVEDLAEWFENNKVRNTSQVPGQKQPTKQKR